MILDGFSWIWMDVDDPARNFDVLRIEQQGAAFGGAPKGAPPPWECCSIRKTSKFLAKKIQIHPNPSKSIQNHAKQIQIHPNPSKSIRPHILENP